MENEFKNNELESVLKKYDIEMRTENGEFRNIEEILNEVAKLWDCKVKNKKSFCKKVIGKNNKI